MGSWPQEVNCLGRDGHQTYNKTDDTLQLGVLLVRSQGCYESIEQRLRLGEGRIRKFPGGK